MPNVAVAVLAGELGLKLNEVYKIANTLGISAKRGAALLAPSQAQRIRAYAEAQKATASVSAVPRQRAAVAAQGVVAPAKVVASVPQPEARGPEHPCACCGLNMGKPREVWLDDTPRRCAECATHFEVAGEEEAQVLRRLRDHEERLRRAYRETWEKADEYQRKMRGAYKTRDSWRAALVETILPHDENAGGGCKCGAKKFPCLTIKTLEASNRGIAKNVDEYCALSDEERELFLWPSGVDDYY